jgi:hypothetical protein
MAVKTWSEDGILVQRNEIIKNQVKNLQLFDAELLFKVLFFQLFYVGQ